MTKKIYVILGILIVALYAILVIYQIYLPGIGEIFGYLFWVIIISGIIAGILLLFKPPKRHER